MTYKEAFGVFGESSLIIVEGRPGSGKTTLVHNLLRDWANGESILVGSKLVVLITLRMSQCNNVLEDYLKVFYSEANMRRKLVEDMEKSNGRDMCFILDGWDEYRYKNQDGVVNQLLRKTYLASSMIIVTSRPVALTCDLKRHSSTIIEVIGFSQDRILEFVRTYPFQEICSECNDMASKLIAYLKRQVNVFHICYLPLHASIICFLYAKNEGSIPSTETKIYEAFTIATVLRKIKREKNSAVQIKSLLDLEGEDRKHFLQICKLAFEMTIKSHQTVAMGNITSLVFPSDDDKISDNFGLGLLTVQNMSMTYGEDQLCSFHHLSFQEFLAAYHLTQLSQELQESFIIQLVNREFMENVFKYYFGIKTFSDTADKIIHRLSLHYDNINMIYFAFESQQSGVCSSFVKLSNGILKFHYCSLTPPDFGAIAYVITKSSHYVTGIEFKQCCLDEVGIAMLTEKHLQHVNFLSFDDRCDSKNIKSLIKKMPHVETIDMSKLNYDFLDKTEGIIIPDLKIVKINILESLCRVVDLIPKFNFGSTKLEQIYFRWTSLRHLKVIKAAVNAHFGFQYYSGLHCPSIYLCSRPKLLQSLAQDRFSTFVEISLINCEIDDNLAVSLSSGFKNSSHLLTVELDYNKIADNGAEKMAKCLMTLPNIKKISLQCNSIGNQGAIAVATSVGQTSSLRILDLQGNYISNEGVVAIAKVTAQLPSLQLYLCNFEVIENGMLEAIKCNKNVNFEENLLNSSSWTTIEESNCKIQALKCGKPPAVELFRSDMKLEDPHSADFLHNIMTLKLTKICITEKSCKCLLYPTNLAHLYFHDVSVLPDFSEDLFFAVTSCKNLQTISLIRSSPFKHIWDVLKCFKHLIRVNVTESISQASINDVDDLCKTCINLRELNLSQNELTFQGSASSLADVGIQKLDLSSNKLTPCVEVMNSFLQRFSNLQYLDLSGSLYQIGKLTYGLEHLSTLAELHLHHNRIDQEDLTSLCFIIRNNSNLRVLNLASNNIDSIGAHTLSKVLTSSTNLQCLDLSRNRLGSEGVYDILNSLRSCISLTILGLAKVNLDEIGMTALCDLQYGKNLRELDLSLNCLCHRIDFHDWDHLPDELLVAISFGEYSAQESFGFHYLAEGLKFCGSLTSLSLAGTGMDQNCALLLVQSLKNCHTLEYIDLSVNPLIDSVGLLILLEGLQHLEKVELDLTSSINSSCEKSLKRGELEECCDICRKILKIYFSNDLLSIKMFSFRFGYIPKLVALKEVL